MENPQTIENLRVVAARGEEVGRFLRTTGLQAAVTITKARIYEDCMKGATLAIREDARSEGRALERLLESLNAVEQDGIIAQKTLDSLDDETE